MKKILGLLVIVLGLTGCVTSEVEAVGKSTQDAVEEHKDGRRTTLDEVTIEVYRVPMGNTMNNGKYLYTKKLHRGEKLRVETNKDYNYEYYSCIRVVEFDSYNLFCNEEDEIHLFDYDDTVGMEVSLNWGGPLRTKNNGKHNEWRLLSDKILHRDDVVGYEDYFYFLKESSLKKFYEEHKDGGRIVWNN